MPGVTNPIPPSGKRLFTAGGMAAGMVLLLLGCGGGSSSNSPPSPPPAISLRLVTGGLTSPLDLQQPDDNSGRLFVVEQRGTIRIVQNGTLLAAPFLDI